MTARPFRAFPAICSPASAKAAKGTSDREYIPVAVLGTRAGTYCVLCREISASGAPKNVLVYVNGDGIQNTYELWIEKHDTKGS